MKENGMILKAMARESVHMQKMMNMEENGKMIKCMAREG